MRNAQTILETIRDLAPEQIIAMSDAMRDAQDRAGNPHVHFEWDVDDRLHLVISVGYAMASLDFTEKQAWGLLASLVDAMAHDDHKAAAGELLARLQPLCTTPETSTEVRDGRIYQVKRYT